MITISIDPVIFSIGHIMIRWYSLVVTLAIIIGVSIAWREAKRKGLAEKHFTDALIWVIAAGLIGARLFHVIDHWTHEYAANPIRALYIWEGGLAIWGAVIGGGIAVAVFAWGPKLPLGRLRVIALGTRPRNRSMRLTSRAAPGTAAASAPTGTAISS